VRAASLRVVQDGPSTHGKSGLLEGSLEQSGVELADDVFGDCARFAKDAVARKHRIVIGDDVLGTERRQLAEHRLDRIGGPADERLAVTTTRLSCFPDSVLAAFAKALGQERRKPREPSYRVTQIDPLVGEPIELRGLAVFPSPLAGYEISEGYEPLEMPMGNGSMDFNSLGDFFDGPFLLVHEEIEQDPAASPILKGADGAIDLGQFIMLHVGSLSLAPAQPTVMLFGYG
jgi:hypothetical protein